MKIHLNSLDLVIFDKNNKKHILFLKKLLKDKTITERFTGFLPRLNAKTNNTVIGKAYFVEKNDDLIGFIDIGSFNEDEKAIYLRGAIDKDLRGKNYGHSMLNEISEYIFKNYPKVKNVKLKIDENNYASIKTALSCGFINILNNYYIKGNPYEKSNTKIHNQLY